MLFSIKKSLHTFFLGLSQFTFICSLLYVNLFKTHTTLSTIIFSIIQLKVWNLLRQNRVTLFLPIFPVRIMLKDFSKDVRLLISFLTQYILHALMYFRGFYCCKRKMLNAKNVLGFISAFNAFELFVRSHKIWQWQQFTRKECDYINEIFFSLAWQQPRNRKEFLILRAMPLCFNKNKSVIYI